MPHQAVKATRIDLLVRCIICFYRLMWRLHLFTFSLFHPFTFTPLFHLFTFRPYLLYTNLINKHKGGFAFIAMPVGHATF